MLIDYEDLPDELRVCFPLRPYADVKGDYPFMPRKTFLIL